MGVTIDAELLATKEQVDLSVLSSSDDKLRMSLLGQMYAADWKYLMVAAGRCYRLSMGQVQAGGDITWNNGHATLDLDQPEAFITVDSGYALIPMEIEIAAQDDMDAYEDELEIVFTADRTQAVAAGGTYVESTGNLATAGGCTIQNLLDGGVSFPGRAAATVTADITDPVHSSVLAYALWELKQVVAETGGGVSDIFRLEKKFDYPEVIKGDCSLLLYVAGTVQPTYGGSIVVGCVPSSWFPVD